MEKKYLFCNIYRSDYDSNLNFYHGKKEVLFPTPGGTVNEKLRAENYADHTPIVFKKKYVFGEPYIYAEPAQPGNYMFGGTYIKTSDSRFREATGISYPIPLHDRQE